MLRAPRGIEIIRDPSVSSRRDSEESAMFGIFHLARPLSRFLPPRGRLQGGNRPDRIMRAKMRICFASSVQDAQLLR
jgi:hypothetical protein